MKQVTRITVRRFPSLGDEDFVSGRNQVHQCLGKKRNHAEWLKAFQGLEEDTIPLHLGTPLAKHRKRVAQAA